VLTYRIVGGAAVDLDARVDRCAAARMAGITMDVVKTWRYRGWVDPKTRVRHWLSYDGGYLVAEILKAERDTRRSGRSHRRLPPPSAYHKVA
jgi:hypothetical protein